MNALDVFRAIRVKALPLMESYRTDLDIDLYTLAQLEARDGKLSPFAHITRRYGTHIDYCIPANALPQAGEQVAYLFGKADRIKMISTIGDTALYFALQKEPVELVQWYDGETITECTIDEACTRLQAYRESLR